MSMVGLDSFVVWVEIETGGMSTGLPEQKIFLRATRDQFWGDPPNISPKRVKRGGKKKRHPLRFVGL